MENLAAWHIPFGRPARSLPPAGSNSASGARRDSVSIASPSSRANSARRGRSASLHEKPYAASCRPCWSNAEKASAAMAAAVFRAEYSASRPAAHGAHHDRARKVWPEYDVFRTKAPAADLTIASTASRPPQETTRMSAVHGALARPTSWSRRDRNRRTAIAGIRQKPPGKFLARGIRIFQRGPARPREQVWQNAGRPPRYLDQVCVLPMSIACTTEIMPRTGTLPATQCTAKPRGWARIVIASFSSRWTKRSSTLGPPSQRSPQKRLQIGPPQP